MNQILSESQVSRQVTLSDSTGVASPVLARCGLICSPTSCGMRVESCRYWPPRYRHGPGATLARFHPVPGEFGRSAALTFTQRLRQNETVGFPGEFKTTLEDQLAEVRRCLQRLQLRLCDQCRASTNMCGTVRTYLRGARRAVSATPACTCLSTDLGPGRPACSGEAAGNDACPLPR
jgi:hypothetical protein